MKKQNGFIKILLIIIAVIAVAVFVYLRMGYRPETIPSNVTDNKTENWKIYHDEKYNFEFKYPENFIPSSTVSKNRQSNLYGSEVPTFFRAYIKTPDLLYKEIDFSNIPAEVMVRGAEFLVEAGFIGKMNTEEWFKQRQEKETAEEKLTGLPTTEKMITINGKSAAMFEMSGNYSPQPTTPEGEDDNKIFPYTRSTTFYVEESGVEITIRLFTIEKDKIRTLSLYETILSTLDFK